MPTPTLIPAIIPESLESLRAHLALLRGVTNAFQIDIVDGIFVPFTSWPYAGENDIQTVRELIAGLDIELDLMIDEPERTLEEWLLTGAGRFVIHVESTTDEMRCIQMVHDDGQKVGLALGNDTPLSAVEPFFDDIDYIQCMGIAEIGVQGAPFDERVLDRVRTIRNKRPDLEIAVDGSVNAGTIKQLHEMGAIRLVSGSAIYAADIPQAAYTALLKHISEY